MNKLRSQEPKYDIMVQVSWVRLVAKETFKEFATYSPLYVSDEVFKRIIRLHICKFVF